MYHELDDSRILKLAFGSIYYPTESDISENYLVPVGNWEIDLGRIIRNNSRYLPKLSIKYLRLYSSCH